MSKITATTKRVFAVLAGTALVTVGAASVAAAAPDPSPVDKVTAGSVSATTTLGSGMGIAAAPSNCTGIATAWAATCYQWDGDDQWVIDGDANGWTAVAYVETNYGKVRECVAPSAADGWKECLFDHRESTCVRFFLYEKKDGNVGRVSAWSPWYSTSTGNRC